MGADLNQATVVQPPVGRQGGKCCCCCCDHRRAVIVVASIIIFFEFIAFILCVTGAYLNFVCTGYVDDSGEYTYYSDQAGCEEHFKSMIIIESISRYVKAFVAHYFANFGIAPTSTFSFQRCFYNFRCCGNLGSCRFQCSRCGSKCCVDFPFFRHYHHCSSNYLQFLGRRSNRQRVYAQLVCHCDWTVHFGLLHLSTRGVHCASAQGNHDCSNFLPRKVVLLLL